MSIMTMKPQPCALLCTNCNTALGLLEDEPQRIEALLTYRLKWK